VDLSKLKLDVYDFLGIILPGLVAIAQGWIFLRGWDAFVLSMSDIKGTSMTLLLVFAFGIGHLVQELADAAIRWTKGPRYKYRARDKFWRHEESKAAKELIRKELGHEIVSVDAAYDFCLTKIRGHFEKRDIFIATSDLSRSFVAMCFLGLIPAAKIAFWEVGPPVKLSLEVAAAEIAVLSIVATLAWRRMMRYRELADVTVFRVYPALASEQHLEPKNEEDTGEEE
jgi:hypothetical protein